ncbi:MAG: hypothetical protein K8U57_32965 [Planctomycetes bacterium]|nr:hypothetical protein [Planctomycetota bacterium]
MDSEVLEPHELAIREFLHEHPEHIPGVRRRPDPQRNGELELMLDTNAMLAFADWVIATGQVRGLDQAKRFREELRKHFGK